MAGVSYLPSAFHFCLFMLFLIFYQFFGGTNFGRTSGGPNYITSYDYDAPIDEYGTLSLTLHVKTNLHVMLLR